MVHLCINVLVLFKLGLKSCTINLWPETKLEKLGVSTTFFQFLRGKSSYDCPWFRERRRPSAGLKPAAASEQNSQRFPKMDANGWCMFPMVVVQAGFSSSPLHQQCSNYHSGNLSNFSYQKSDYPCKRKSFPGFFSCFASGNPKGEVSREASRAVSRMSSRLSVGLPSILWFRVVRNVVFLPKMWIQPSKLNMIHWGMGEYIWDHGKERINERSTMPANFVWKSMVP